MSRRNPDTQTRWVRMLIYKHDKQRCRWCHEPVRFKDSMVVAHGIAFADAPTLDTIDNWYTSCEDCNKVGKNSFPPGPIPLDETSVPQLQETNEQLQTMGGQLQAMGERLREFGSSLAEFVDYSKPKQEVAPEFNPEACQAKGAGCERMGCQIPKCVNYTHFAYSEGRLSGGRSNVISEYDPLKDLEWKED